jgi:hypothetical protein
MQHQNFTWEQGLLLEKCQSIIKDHCRSSSNIRFSTAYVDECDTLVVELSGGLNGRGSWDYYLLDLSEIMHFLNINEMKCWLIDIKNDCLDDVFQVRFGIRKI